METRTYKVILEVNITAEDEDWPVFEGQLEDWFRWDVWHEQFSGWAEKATVESYVEDV